MAIHFARLYQGDQLDKALSRHEHYLFARLGLRSGMRVLDIGCGIGQVAFELANLYSVRVVGVDTSENKIQIARSRAQDLQLAHRVSFLHASLTEIIEESVMGKFDAIYAVESLAGEPGFEQIYRQCYHLLEPRGIFGVYEWCWTTRFDPLNNSHCQMANIIEDYAGISRRGPTERLLSTAIKALQKNHFEVIESADLSERKDSSTHIPWYKLLENAVQSPHFRWPLHHTSGDLTKDAARVLLQAGIYNLFTPMAMIISRRVDTS
ncbi:S-adenosyl-L-methionine-dependent methyltransferase [Agrocybe pediades]|nr:S-adenosyl-L-methionine-dependent methyltransferase [Agrocybe pediades]